MLFHFDRHETTGLLDERHGKIRCRRVTLNGGIKVRLHQRLRLVIRTRFPARMIVILAPMASRTMTDSSLWVLGRPLGFPERPFLKRAVWLRVPDSGRRSDSFACSITSPPL